MSDPEPDPAATDLLHDPLLRTAPTIEGFKVLDPAVLYAKVGQGGMGAVYRGRHCKLDLDVAVKCLKPSLAADSPEFIARFEREARLCASLAHQNVVRVMDVRQQDGLHWLVMEFVRGETVRERVQRKGPLAEAEALAILHGACAGLAEAHGRGIVHRDIKPDNLMVSLEGRVKVADLGLAKGNVAGDQSLSLASGVMGTPQYMAPEQWDSPDIGSSADVWALGAVLYFVLTGEHGIDGATFAVMARRVQEHDFPSLATKCPALRPAVLQLFARCIARRPADRFASAKELLAALTPLVTIGEEQLADAGAERKPSRLGTVTPPPRQTLLRIRAKLETGTGIGGARAAAEAPTIPSPGGTERMPPPRAARRARWPWLFATVLLVGGGVAAYGYQDGWFDDPAAWEATLRLAEARTLYSDAQQLLPQPDGLDAAIEKLERVVELQPDFPAAKQLLARGLDKRAEQLTGIDLDRAYEASLQASELDPNNTLASERREQLRKKLSGRLFVGLDVTAPPHHATVPGARFVVRGKVDAKDVRKVVLVVQAVADNGEPRQGVEVQRLPATLAAGELDVVVTARVSGWHSLALVAEDRHGVTAGTLPSRVLVPGTAASAGAAPDPRAVAPQVCWNGAGCELRPIPVRTFRMGSLELELDRDVDELQHSVTLREPFWIGSTEVTQQQWVTVMATGPWAAADAPPAEPGADPATSVTWAMANEFCAALTEREREAGRLPEGYLYCLPTEAQWELAALGGRDGNDFPHGDDAEQLSQHAVFGGGELLLQPVGSKLANAFGLFDLAGNVDEWCADAADGDRRVANASADGAVEPLLLDGEQRLVRGGSYRSPAADCRCAARRALPPETAADWLGFRVVLAKR
jgi:formylglycine-generating enzyme required for sulfatase activity/tetratricopeptide (TPR) repeat protein